jgi:hypothetical protein
MMPITITIEPLAPSSERSAGAGGGTSTARVGIVAAPGLAASEAPDLIEPVVGFRSWRIFRDGPARGELSSPQVPVAWQEPVMRAECRRFRRAEDLLEAPHAAPDPVCGCGICARHKPTDDFSRVDFQGVSGIVTVWGRIVVDGRGMRAEYTRVEALGLYSRWSRRQRDAARRVAAELGVDLVELRELGVAARGYGEALPVSLLGDERPQGLRERFSALFASQVGPKPPTGPSIPGAR